MSATAPLRRPAALRLPAPSRTTATPKATTRPRLVLITQRRTTAGRLPFMILVGGVLSVGLVAVLLLHMLAAQDAYRAHALQQQLSTLTDQEQELSTAVDADSSPSALRARAQALGMRPANVTKFKRLKDGRAIGVQTPVVYTPPVTTTTTTTTSTPKTAKTGTATTGATTSGTAKAGATKSGTVTTGTATTVTATTGTATGHHHTAATKP